MYIPDELKLNKFKLVPIRAPRDYFGLVQEIEPSSSAYTGDEPAVMAQNKLDSIAEADAEYRDYLNKE